MFTSPKPKRLAIACSLTCALFVSGLITLTTDVRRVIVHHLPPPVNAPFERQTAPRAEPVDEETRGRVSEVYGKLPLSFEENRGQVDAEVRYVSRGAGYTLFLTPGEAVLSLRSGGDGEARGEKERPRPRQPRAAGRRPQSAVLRMKLKNANPAPAVTGESELGARANYFIGNDPKNWHTDVARFGRVRYSQLYPGIDMIYYGEQRQLEYDFEVAPGVDSSQIALEFAGVRRMRIERATGDLVLTTDGGEVRQRRPVSYQEEGGVRREVLSRYVLKGEREVGIEVGEYDRTRRLVIDPVLSYSTYLGGGNQDVGNAIAVDAAGYVYVTGTTDSSDFPAFGQPKPDDSHSDAFISKFNTNLSGAASLVYSAYLGGTTDGSTDAPGIIILGAGTDIGTGIAVDAAGNAYITGSTDTTDFPVRNQYQPFQGIADAFVARFNTNISGKSSLVYSTYLGGSDGDSATGIAADASGHAYVTGSTSSTNFPTLNQYQGNQAGIDAFVTKLDTNAAGAASLLYSTYLGGADQDNGNGIAVDPNGLAYVVGTTRSSNFPTFNEYQSKRGFQNAFVTQLDTTSSGPGSLGYSTYLGGGGEQGRAIAVDQFGSAYVAGTTGSADFPIVNGYQPTRNGVSNDVFVARLEPFYPGQYSLVYSTYLGGSDQDYGTGVATDQSGGVYVTGTTSSTDFPVLNQYRPRSQSEVNYSDAFVAKLDTSVFDGPVSLIYSTYLGGAYIDRGNGIAADSNGYAYATGETWSGDFPVVRPFQREQFQDAFVTKLKDTFFISGRVTSTAVSYTDGLPLGIDGVAVTLSGTQSRSVVTTRGGYFFFANLERGGTYNVTFSKGALAFQPDSYNIINLQYNARDHSAYARPANVSGRVTIGTADGAGLAGVTMTLTGDTNFDPRTATTNSAGVYSFGDVPTPGTYKITPSKTNYSFSPGQLSLVNLAADLPNTNYVAIPRTYTVGGVIKHGAAGLGGVTVKLTSPTPTGFAARTATTDDAGVYSFPNLPAGRSYTVTPVRTGYRFTPASKSLSNLSANQTTVNFLVTVYSVSGRVVRAGATTGLASVTLTLTSPTPAGLPARTAQTTSAGYYTFTNLPAGRNYTLKPAKSGFTFSPTSRTILSLSGNIPAGTSTSFTGTGP